MKRLFATTLAVLLMTTSSVSALAVDLTDSPATNNGAGDYTIGVNGIINEGDDNEAVISVDILWDSMNFTYTDGSAGTWNPDTHAYEGATQGTWSTDKAGITVANHSDSAVETSFSFAANSGVNVTGTFYTQNADNSYTALSAEAQQFSLATAVGTDRASAPSGTICFGVSGDPISATQTSLGTITVHVAKSDNIRDPNILK